MKALKNNPRIPLAAVRGDLEIKYKHARLILLLVVLFTGLNLFSATFTDTYFLFSATVPMIFPIIGASLAEELGNNLYLYAMLGVGVLLVVPYLLCWIFSKKRVGWMIASLIFFSLDCVLLLLSFDFSMIMDILFHGIVMFYLITGVMTGLKLKDLPAEDPLAPTADTPAEDPFGTFDRADFNYDTPSADTDRGEAHVAKSDKE